MTRQSLLEEIRRLSKDNNLRIDEIAYDEFLLQTEFEYLKLEFNKYKLKKEKWHQLVRFAFSDTNAHRYMYDRLLRLLQRYRSNYNDYFKLKTETGTVLFPDRVSEINILFSIYKEYFAIFREIIHRIHFDYPTKKVLSNFLQGKIDWEGTIRNNYASYPVKFQLIKWQREFVTTENILLALCALWLNKSCKTLLNISFVEPLNVHELNVLNYIMHRTRTIVNFFPFQDVKAFALKFSILLPNDRRILDLERIIEMRLSQGILQSKSYYDLLQWWRKFRHMNIRLISPNRTNFPIETLENLDTIYEAWIFFEFVDFFSQQQLLFKLQVDKEPNFFEIKYKGHNIRFYYEKKFVKGFEHAWAVDSFPDFTVLENDNIIAVFDAKNYGASSESKGDATHKILAYLTNLDCGFGGLFFPKFESVEYRYPELNRDARYHSNLLAGHYKMEPSNSEDAIKTKKENLSKIFLEIIRRIKPTGYR